MSDRKAIALLLGAIALAYCDLLLLGRGFYRADVVAYHYPMKRIVRDVVARGEFPYWNRFLSSGQPLAANPAYEVWYPPQWLVFLPSFHYGFQLHIAVHFFLAALGMYLLLRSLAASPPAAIFGALAFALGGSYVSLTSKLPLLFAASWMPLALYFVRELLRERTRPRLAGAAFCLAMQLLLGEPTVVLQTWGFIAAYVVWRAATTKRASLRDDVVRVAAAGAIAVLLAAVQLVPALDFARDTVRSRPFEYRVVSNWSMPLVRPLELLLPSLFSDLKMTATMYPYRTEPYVGEIYAGMLVAVLALAGLLSGKRGAGLAATGLLVACLFAWGEHTPLLRVLYELHLFRSIRYPEKFVLSAAFVVVVWAALMFDRLRGDRALARNATVVAVLTMLVAAAVAAGSHSGAVAMSIVRAAIVVALVGPLRTRLSDRAWLTTAIALTAVDLVVSLHATTQRMPRSFFDPAPLAASLPRGGLRVFHEEAWDRFDAKPEALARTAGMTPAQYGGYAWAQLFPNLPAMYGAQLTLENDIDLTSLLTTDELREKLKEARRGLPGAQEQLLKMSNVGTALRLSGLERVEGWPRYAFADRIDRGFFRAEPTGSEKVAYADVDVPASPGRVSDVVERDNAVSMTTENAGRGLLLIAITRHRYWSATIDGRAATLLPANVAYQALDVPAGKHRIALRYRNPLIVPSAIVSLLTLLVLAAVTARASRPALAGPPGPASTASTTAKPPARSRR